MKPVHQLNPYHDAADHQFWRRAVAGVEPFRIDPIVDVRFTIGRDEPVATAGSCFAQHISRRLTGVGFNYFVPEEGQAIAAHDRAALGYGVFSARFGNIYTVRQLLQLFQECFEGRSTAEDAWQLADGRFVDALRPQVLPGGFDDVAQVRAARQEHLQAVRRMFDECAVFVFTLGLTEAWTSTLDGTVYPLAPGVAGGSFDPTRHAFVNFSIDEVAADLALFLQALKVRNPAVKVILTVSPVPLIATYEPRHVLVANSYSKSVLRVAAETAYRTYDWVEYFPSYEIITGNYNDSAYYEADYRNVNPLGVDHAMRCFLAHYTDSAPTNTQACLIPDVDFDIVCDEEAIDQIRV